MINLPGTFCKSPKSMNVVNKNCRRYELHMKNSELGSDTLDMITRVDIFKKKMKTS